jgi:hypothetical protein
MEGSGAGSVQNNYGSVPRRHLNHRIRLRIRITGFLVLITGTDEMSVKNIDPNGRLTGFPMDPEQSRESTEQKQTEQFACFSVLF